MEDFSKISGRQQAPRLQKQERGQETRRELQAWLRCCQAIDDARFRATSRVAETQDHWADTNCLFVRTQPAKP
jgi:hypothetical protein